MRSWFCGLRQMLQVAVMGLLVSTAVLLSGCASNSTKAEAVPAKPGASPQAVAPVTTTASPTVTDATCTFRQLVPAHRTINRPGIQPVYRFSHVGRDGMRIVCEMPSPMAEGRQTRSAWEATFEVYRVGQATAAAPAERTAANAGLADAPWRQRRQDAQRPQFTAIPMPIASAPQVPSRGGGSQDHVMPDGAVVRELSGQEAWAVEQSMERDRRNEALDKRMDDYNSWKTEQDRKRGPWYFR